MLIEVDPAKDAANIRKHGISLGRFTEMDFDATLSGVDAQHSTGTETRWIFFGPISGQLWVAVVTFRGSVTRVISLRPASHKERRMYGDST
jgi:uncharacterized DUF497 family protein